MFNEISRRQFVKLSGGFVVGATAAGSTPLINVLTANAQNSEVSSIDYSTIPEWVPKDTGYHTGEMVKYQGNIFRASYWAGKEPGVDPGWTLYDELYNETTTNQTEQAKVIAYIPTWRKQEGFNYSNAEIYQSITHGIISFLMFSETNLGEFEANSLNDVNAIINDVINTGHQQGTYILIALGGATDYGFLNLMTAIGNNTTSPLLDKAVENVKTFVESNGLDGVDLDLECWWDKNSDASKDQGGRQKSDGAHPAGYALTLFAQKLKEAMPGKLISAAVFATSWYGNNYDPKIADYLDWIGVMTYDLTGSWNQSPVGPHTALRKIRNQEAYAQEQQGSWPISGQGATSGSDPMIDNPILSVEDALWYWSNPFFMNWQGSGQKIPRNKIAAGVPNYGYDFAYKKDPDPLSGQVPPGYKVIRYKDILGQFPNANTAANANIKISGSTPRPSFISASGNYPYAHNIYFETPETASVKLNFLKQVGAQGVIIWEISNELWEEGKSIIQGLYKNSGNPQVRPSISSSPSLPSGSKQIFPKELMGIFPNEWFIDTRLSSTKSVKSLAQNSIPSLLVTKTNIAITGTPSVAIYNDKLFCVYEGAGEDGWLWFCIFDGTNWSDPQKLPNHGTSGPPAIAVYNDKLFCIHEGGRGDGWLWFCIFDGTNWSEDQRLPNHGTSSRQPGIPPAALVVYKNQLYCIHEGAGEDGWLWFCIFDGTNWSEDRRLELNGSGVGTSGAPGVAVINDKLYCCHEGREENGLLYHSSWDGENDWLLGTDFALEGNKNETSGPPGIVVRNGKAYFMHQGKGKNGKLYSFSNQSYDSYELYDSSSSTTIGISRSPALVEYKDKILALFEDSQENGSLCVLKAELPEEIQEFNLLLSPERSSAPYLSLPRYNTALNTSGSNPNNYPVEVMRHHIVPHNRLVAFWNQMVTRGELISVGRGLLQIIENNIGQYSIRTYALTKNFIHVY
ncbi:glycosyl hydrolase family 18 protein [Nostoc parmelioides]|uniref:chitinase n=1 Tax=Nostoc parmelioides FACHB-3921 TaxID=2692909 RepID=A0ABR8BN05_9NOSO|nr:glycosyl hydrolase family 18 protein [Nostoc parmelioides]MBD2255508.1 hypothetical protein [Nostoc parmelioides FACHB-3921]